MGVALPVHHRGTNVSFHDETRYQNFSPSTEETTNRSDSHALFTEETILGAFRELLASKDDRDAELEKKLGARR